MEVMIEEDVIWSWSCWGKMRMTSRYGVLEMGDVFVGGSCGRSRRGRAEVEAQECAK